MTVKQKQWQLFFLGFLEREDQLDGIWGAVSAKATASFQKEFGIMEDGVFGADTQAKSREVIEGIQEAVAAFGEGGLVRDGLAGPKTMEAAAKCQNALGLAPTGIADKKTRQRIAALSGSGREEKDQEEAWWQEIRYFTPEEFRCRCGEYCDGAPARMREDVVRIAEAARRHFGRPGIVVSGLRCRQHNANAGGMVNSQHMYGEAVDLRIQGVSGDALLGFLRSQKGVRYAYRINETNVHFDVPKGAR